MCGLVGFVGPGDRDDLDNMTRAIAHRGPDGEGHFIDPEQPVFLGHRRLAILDVAAGAQPMWNTEKSIVVVYNGEIYNHQALREELEQLGYRFQTDHCDTEVLIQGYHAWGEGLPERLNGMFAFAIYDRPRKCLFLARDRFGEKPLYIARQGSLFAFASEISAIRRHRQFHARLSRRSVAKFLAHGYLPAPNGIYEDCEKLPGGTCLTYDIVTGHQRQRRYWQFRLNPDPRWLDRSEGDLIEELQGHLFEATRRRLISDVPLGFFLSGGIDSSAVLAAASRFLPSDDLHAFTLGFREPSFDESQPARKVANSLGAHHAIEWLDLETARQAIVPILSQLDEPQGDASILPTALLARFTRKTVKVALSGDGADELFAGYDPFVALSPARTYQTFIPRPLHQLLRGAVDRLPISDRNMSLEFRLKRTLSGLEYPDRLWNPVWMAPAGPRLLNDLLQEPISPEEVYSEALDLWGPPDNRPALDKALEFYTNFYLQDGILTKVDRAAMLSGLEARAVFLDNDLVSFCQRLPQSFKLRGRERKYLLKRALVGLLPDEILKRPKKGFGMPTAKWLRTIPPEPPMAPVAGMRMDAVGATWKSHRRGEVDQRLFLWSWLALQSFDAAAAAELT